MWWAPQSHNQQAAPQGRRFAPADGGSTAASEWQPYRCAKHCGESPWWCACAPPGQGSRSWPSWPLKSSTPPSPSPGSPPPGTASSSPSITSATCARTQRDSRPDRDSGEGTATCYRYQAPTFGQLNGEVRDGGSGTLPTSKILSFPSAFHCILTWRRAWRDQSWLYFMVDQKWSNMNLFVHRDCKLYYLARSLLKLFYNGRQLEWMSVKHV